MKDSFIAQNKVLAIACVFREIIKRSVIDAEFILWNLFFNGFFFVVFVFFLRNVSSNEKLKLVQFFKLLSNIS